MYYYTTVSFFPFFFRCREQQLSILPPRAALAPPSRRPELEQATEKVVVKLASARLFTGPLNIHSTRERFQEDCARHQLYSNTKMRPHL